MRTLKFELTMDEANLLITALCELPAKVSLGLINKLQDQAQAYLNAMEPTNEATNKESENG